VLSSRLPTPTSRSSRLSRGWRAAARIAVGSGATIEQTVWQFSEWRQKKCVRFLHFASEAEALEAAGLSEYAMSQENVTL
jgi:hypothetical protein